MSAIPDAGSSPMLAERWIKANIASAIISGLASFGVYLVKNAVGAGDPDPGTDALLILYIAAIVFSGISGIAGGVLTGAVLQRIVRRLPARTWIALHAAMSIGVGVMIELMEASRATSAGEAIGVDPGVLPSSVVFGAALGAMVGGLEALVMRPVASGLGHWVKWSAIAYAGAWLLLVTGATLLEPGGGLSSELVNQALSFAAAVIVGLLTLPALSLLHPRAS